MKYTIFAIYIMNEARLSLELTPAALVGLICASSGIARLPALTWALEIAVEALRDQVFDERSCLRRATARLGHPQAEMRRVILRRTLCEMVRTRQMRIEGQGWEAGYVPDEAWRDACLRTARSLPRRDRQALDGSAQRLRAALTTWSKKAVASGPVG